MKFSNFNVLRMFLIFGENSNISCFFQDFLRKWLFEGYNVLNTFLTFEPLKPYVLIYFVLIRKKRVKK